MSKTESKPRIFSIIIYESTIKSRLQKSIFLFAFKTGVFEQYCKQDTCRIEYIATKHCQKESDF